jgi:hypothetical protein
MSSIVIAGGLILILVIIILILVSINNNNRKKTVMELVDRFNESGRRNNLSFTQKEMMENFIIGLDEIRMKLFVLRNESSQYDFQVIDLKEIKSCSKKKVYKSVNMGTIKKERFENHIDKIVLQFDFLDNRAPIQIAFYESGEDHVFKMPELERKAGSWAVIVSQTLKGKSKSIQNDEEIKKNII